MTKKIELMAPAGDIRGFMAAIASGADAVYLGLKDLNARRKAKNFSIPQLSLAVNHAHSLDRKVYVALNTLIKNEEVDKVVHYLNCIRSLNVDAVIIQDLGLLYILRKWFPEITVHASTQMSLHNSAGIVWAERQGIKRVILPRELHINELKKIRKKSAIELESFCHGALCYSYSGLCWFSSFLGGSSANRGICKQPCRRNYHDGETILAPFSMPDLCLIEHIPTLIGLGLDALKIEGRLRTIDYLARVTAIYRKVIDTYYEDKTRIKKVIAEAHRQLTGDFARRKSSGFLIQSSWPRLIYPGARSQTGDLIGEISFSDDTTAVITLYKPVTPGDTCRLRITEDTPLIFTVSEKQVNGSGSNTITLPVSQKCIIGTRVYRIKTAAVTEKWDKHYPVPDTVIPNSDDIIKEVKASLNKQSSHKPLQIMKAASFSIQFDNPGLINAPELSFFDRWVFQLNYKSVREGRIPGYDKTILSQKQRKKLCYSLPEIIPEDLLPLYRKTINRMRQKSIFFISHVSHLHILSPRTHRVHTNPTVFVLNPFARTWLTDNRVVQSSFPLECGKSDIQSLLSYTGPGDFNIIIYTFPLLFLSRTLAEGCTGKTLTDDRKHGVKTFFDGEFYRTVSSRPVSLLRKLKDLNSLGLFRFMVDVRNTITTRKELHKIIGYIQEPEKVKDYTIYNYKQGLR